MCFHTLTKIYITLDCKSHQFASSITKFSYLLAQNLSVKLSNFIVLSIQFFSLMNLIYRRSNFVYHNITMYHSVTYPLRSIQCYPFVYLQHITYWIFKQLYFFILIQKGKYCGICLFLKNPWWHLWSKKAS